MSTIVKAQTPADLLAFAPHLLGYTPTKSVVLMLFDGNRTCGALRLDLPADSSAQGLKQFANVALGTITRVPDVRSIVPVIFTDHEFGDDSLIPHTDLFDVLARRSRHMGFPFKEALCLAADGWGSYFDRVTPRGGRPLSEVRESDVTDRVPEDARAVAGDQNADSQPIPVDEEAAARATKRVQNLGKTLQRSATRPTSSPSLNLLADVPWFAEWVLAWTDEELTLHGPLLLFALQGPPMRDHTMLQWATSREIGELLFDEVEGAQGDPFVIDPMLGDLMLGIGPRPDLERVRKGITLLRKLLAMAESRYRPAPLCMLAWLSWATGRTSHAAGYIEQARTIDPAYSMAELLEQIISSGMLPQWAFDKQPGD